MSRFDRALDTARSHFLQMPLLTRALLIIMIGLFIAGRATRNWVAWELLLSLNPEKMNLKQLHRLNTYPLVHTDIFHLVLNLLALIPMLGGFEKEKGTLTTLLMIVGPVMYLLIEIYIVHGTASVVGSSVWVFLLAAIEAMKAYRISPFYTILGYRIPTWSTPIWFTLLAALIFPSSSFLGHLCALAVGYAYALNYLKFFEPPEKILAFVESKLKFVLDKIKPMRYISLDKRDIMAGIGGESGIVSTGTGGSYLPVSNPPAATPMEFVGTGPEGRPLGTS